MNILGISCFYHDSAACLVVDGKIVAAAQEEVCILFGFFVAWHGISWLFILVGIVLVCAALLATQTLFYPYMIWMAISVIIGFFVLRLFLVVLYFCVMIPAGMVMRLFQSKKSSTPAATYWIKIPKQNI